MTLLLNLPPDLEAKLEAEAIQKGITLSECALQKLYLPLEIANNEAINPLIVLSEKMRASMPESEWTKLPQEYASNYKSYLRAAQTEKE